MKSIETFLEKFNCIPFEEKPQILFQAWEKFFAIQYSKPEDPNKLFQKLLDDLKELAEYENSQSRDRPIFLNDDEDHSDQNKECFENSSDEIAASNPNQEKENLQDLDIQLLCIHDNVDDLIESALNTKLILINSQRLDNKEQEVENVIEQPTERGNRSIESLQNFKVVHKSSNSLNNTSQISPIHVIAPILPTKEPEYSPSMMYEHSNTTPKIESDEIIKFGVEELVPILSENEVTSKDKREYDLPVCENSPICNDHSKIFSDSNNDDDISSDDDDFKDIEYVEAALSNPEIVNQKEENDVEEEEIDLENVFQIQDIVLREKLLSINRLIANIESLNDNPTPVCVLNSFVSFPISEESDNSLSDNFSPKFETFCDHTEETRSGNTTTHADNSLPEYDSFCFEIEPDQERLINVLKSDISNDSSNDPLLEEADLFLASDNSIPPGIENVANDSEGDDNPSVPLPPLEPPDEELDFEINFGDEILVVRNTIVEFECIDARVEFDVSNDKNDDYSYFMFVMFVKTMALNHDSLSPVSHRQANVPQADRTVTTSYELDLLFSPMFDELLNGSSKVVSQSSVISAADASNQRQHQTTPLTTHTTTAPTCQVPTLEPTVISSENINQAKTNDENDQVADDEFINIFSTPVQDQGETSSRHVDSSNMHTFYQRYPFEHRWTKDHPLEQVIGNPLQSVRTRRQLESNAEMCMFALTVSRTEPKNIKETMEDSAWIKSMQEELH
nr:Gag-Pol polyprotein [Tanacetum cinerariifolium]